MNTFQTQAKDLLGLTADRTTLYLDGDLTVSGNISLGGSTGATGSSDLTVGNLTVNETSTLTGAVSMEAGMGCTGNATFYGQIRGRSFLFGVMEYLYLAVNNVNDTWTVCTPNESIIYAMNASPYESSSNGISISGSGGDATYIQPVSAGMYMMSFFARLKDGDGGETPGVIPCIYARDQPASFWYLASNTPQFCATVNGTQIMINYQQPCFVPSGGDTRIDLRAYVTNGFFNVIFGTFYIQYVSSI